MTIKCYEFFNCRRINECPFYKEGGDRNCWEVEGALTPFAGGTVEEDKIVFCKHCLYYRHVHEIKD